MRNKSLIKGLWTTLAATALLAVVVVFLSSCDKSELSGTWTIDSFPNMSYTFSGSKFILKGTDVETGKTAYEESGTYTLEDGQLRLEFDNGAVQTAEYSVSGKALTLGTGILLGGSLTKK